MNIPTRRLVPIAALALLLPAAGCGGDDSSGGSGSTTITVLAASSLTESFTALAHDFEADNPGVHVKLAFDSSATLAQQAVGGAPADVLATADPTTMASAKDVLADQAQDFASNTMVLVTPKDNPAGITGFDDLQQGNAKYVACVETAPCGKVASALLSDNHVTAKPASLEVDVKSVLAKVTSDEADAGIVYRTDAMAAGSQVKTFDIPHAADEVTTYPIATLQQSGEADLADQFVNLVLSSQGEQVLRKAGFGKP